MKNSIAVALAATLLCGTASGQIFRLRAGGFGPIDSFTTSGTPINTFASSLRDPTTIALDGAGHLFTLTADHSGVYSIAEYTTSGTIVNSSLVSGLIDPFGLACDGNGGLYVAIV